MQYNWHKHLLQAIGLLLLLVGLSACSKSEQNDASAKVLSALPTEVADYLIQGNNDALAAHCNEVGLDQTIAYIRAIGPLRDHLEDRDLIDRYRISLAEVIATEFDYPFQLDRTRWFAGLPLETRIEYGDKWVALRNTYNDAGLSNSEKIENTLALQSWFRELGDPTGVAMCHSNLSDFYSEQGNVEAKMRHLYKAVYAFEKLGYHLMTSQLLGVIGAIHDGAGNVDSMVFYYEKGASIAHSCRLPEAGRFSEFYAAYFARQGRISLAHELLNEAQNISREYKAGFGEVRYVIRMIRFHADLGCWDVVDRLLKRARILERRYVDIGASIGSILLLRSQEYEARMQMARKNVAEADSICYSIVDEYEDSPHASDYIAFLYYWADGLLDNGLGVRALELVGRGQARLELATLPEWAARFALLEAQAAFAVGDFGRSRNALLRFDVLARDDRYIFARERIERDVLAVRHTVTGTGDVTRAVRDALRGIERTVEQTDAGVHGYLWLDGLDDLRRTLQDIAGDDPAAGLGADLAWRNLARRLGTASRTPYSETESDPADGLGYVNEWRARARTVTESMARVGGVYCTYLILNDRVVRWTVTPQGLRKDRLNIEPRDLRERVARTWTLLETESESDTLALGSPLHRELTRLSQTLLPEQILAASDSPQPFFIMGDDCLSRIPFEAFDVSNDEDQYIPLLAKRNVAYIRHARRLAARRAKDSGLIVAAPSLAKDARRRSPSLASLRWATKEANTVREALPEAAFLTGETATKSRLQAQWERTRFLYLGTHTIRDPQVPYLVLIPLAAPDGAAPDASYLDITDIRAADFSGCDLVLLSACSTGAPYVDTRTVGPSLGDAFLDAGAGAVIQTFWDVRDDEAAAIVTSFAGEPGAFGTRGIEALCNTKRGAMRSPGGGIRHPSAWAAYSIQLGGFRDQWDMKYPTE